MEHPGRLVLLSTAEAAAPRKRWRRADGLLWRSWDDEVVVYDDRSGDTHRLAARAAVVFLALASPAAAENPDEGTGGLDPEILDGLAILRLVEQRA
jgi:hypothetical protein